ncbi:MAG: class I tRNA ligase family protein, partial [Qipengyuania sp.]|uniref:class I tRNA ligase family protein n=1 Tax=Qipengyuania sp. TaxID=2004515 RepID=UPI003001786B
PLGLIDQYGADALRFFMAAMESQGRDIKMDDKRIEGYRNFATKLWNATRFCQSNGIGASTSIAAPKAASPVNKWIIGEIAETKVALDTALTDLRFDAAANTIYHFVWDRFCDWYLELIKPDLTETAEIYPEIAEESRLVASWALDQILVMLHPFMPFVTEELWHSQGDRKGPDGKSWPLITARWPAPGADIDAQAKSDVDWFIEVVTKVRGARTELGVSPGTQLVAFVEAPSENTTRRINQFHSAFRRLARIQDIEFGKAPTGALMQVGIGDDNFLFPLEGVIDIEAEKTRLSKALEASAKEAKSLEGRLSNANFVERAKPEAVEKARADHAHHTAEVARLEAALARLG